MTSNIRGADMLQTTNDVALEFRAVVDAAFRISADVGREIEAILRDGRAQPLSREEATALLVRVMTTMRQNAEERRDKRTLDSLKGNLEEIARAAVDTRHQAQATSATRRPTNGRQVELVSRGEISVGPVEPVRVFHGRPIPMRSGFVKTSDIQLWEGNERLEIHLSQFRHQYGRSPTPEELRQIMMSKLKLPGIMDLPDVSLKEKEDQFEIEPLARSIAANGVRVPPIISQEGRLLDGNRRVAACYYILHSDEFDSEEKQRAEYIFVWQLTEFATSDDHDAVVVSLNFEQDYKEPWPEYIRAQKVYDKWQAMLRLERRVPGPERQTELKKELAKKFAMDLPSITRYIKMIEWANDFEDYHIHNKGRDEFEVKHRTNRYFQYFDEMAKGARSGVAYALTQDDAFRNLVFELLYGGKFKNWRQIRELKLMYDNQESRDLLVRAREEKDPDAADKCFEDAIAVARLKSVEQRELAANTRIESFYRWLEQLPVGALRDKVTKENHCMLLRALKLVESHARDALGDEGIRECMLNQ